MEHATIRVWLSRKVPWLPQPDGRLNGGAVWRATTLEGIETRRERGRPGRKPKFVPAPAAAEVPRTGMIPVVPRAAAATTTTGASSASADRQRDGRPGGSRRGTAQRTVDVGTHALDLGTPVRTD